MNPRNKFTSIYILSLILLICSLSYQAQAQEESLNTVSIQTKTPLALEGSYISRSTTPTRVFHLNRRGNIQNPLLVYINWTETQKYVPNSAPKEVLFQVGESQTILTIESIQDDIPEPHGEFTAHILAHESYMIDPNAASAQVRVLNDDFALTAALDPLEYTVNEGQGSLKISFDATTPANIDVPTVTEIRQLYRGRGYIIFSLSSRSSSAKSSSDYIPFSTMSLLNIRNFQPVTINDQTHYRLRGEVSVNIIDDVINEDTESFSVILERSPGLEFQHKIDREKATALIHITDNDPLPQAPKNLRAVNVSRGHVNLTWQKPSDIDNYKTKNYQYRTSEGGPFGEWISPANKFFQRQDSEVSLPLHNLKMGRKHRFQVRSETEAGYSKSSNTAFIILYDVPARPKAVTADYTDEGLKLSWEHYFLNYSPDILKHQYRIKMEGEQSFGSWVDIPNSEATTGSHYETYLISGPRKANDLIQVRAVNSIGNGQPSDPITAILEISEISLTERNNLWLWQCNFYPCEFRMKALIEPPTGPIFSEDDVYSRDNFDFVNIDDFYHIYVQAMDSTGRESKVWVAEGPDKVEKLATKGSHNCALFQSGRIKCWGDNSHGQLGYETDERSLGNESGEMGESLAFVNLGTDTYGNYLRAIDITTGSKHSCAILSNFRVKCWGYNAFGGLGLGHRKRAVGNDPGEMGDELPFVDLGRTPNGKHWGVKALSAGAAHTCAILGYNERAAAKGVKCWGANNLGQLGLGHSNHRGRTSAQMGANLPFVNLGRTNRWPYRLLLEDLQVGYNHTCVILTTHKLKCWGDNKFGQLGQGQDSQDWGSGRYGNLMGNGLPIIDLGGAPRVQQVVLGRSHTCASLLENGLVKCWGYSENGESGLASRKTRGDDPREMGTNLPHLYFRHRQLRTAFLTAGGSHNCIIFNLGGLKCWGANSFGQLGRGHTYNLGDNNKEHIMNIDYVNFLINRVKEVYGGKKPYLCPLL